jgi:hypothetical protein
MLASPPRPWRDFHWRILDHPCNSLRYSWVLRLTNVEMGLRLSGQPIAPRLGRESQGFRNGGGLMKDSSS